MFRLFVGLLVAMIASTGAAASAQSFPEFGPNVSQPQLQAIGDEGLLLVWKQRGPDGSDLFVSYSDGGSFSAPMRINDVAGSVNRSPIDEMRASVSIGPGDKVAVAWTDRGFDIRVAVGDIGGRFAPSVKLNQTEGRVLQEFPSISFDAAGVLHAVWLDPRVAERERAEEPADLYYARFEDGVVTERNLTADQDSSVCGCCLPDIRAEDNGRLTITFRNTTADGYRDPFKIVGTPGGRFGSPEPVSPPIWKINACPVAGPISVGERILWFDGSTDRRRLLSSSDPDEAPAVVIEDSDDWSLRYPPRMVSGTGGSTELLVPGRPGGYLLTLNNGSWRVRFDDLPGWATSAVVHAGKLILVGSDQGVFKHEIRDSIRPK